MATMTQLIQLICAGLVVLVSMAMIIDWRMPEQKAVISEF